MTGRRDAFARLPPADVVINAIALHLDAIEREIIPEEAVSRVVGQS